MWLDESGKFTTVEDYSELQIKLCDFTAKILEEIEQDTGLEDKAVLRIQATRHDGMVLGADVPASKFFAKNSTWVNDMFGTRLIVEPGNKSDHIKVAIHKYSILTGDINRSKIYCFTGWKQLEGQWHYLTGTGAITKDGLTDTIQTDLGSGHMGKYQLPAPFSQDRTKEAAQAALTLLQICPNKSHIGAVLLAAVARAPLGECHPVDFCLFLHGLTGTKKSSITALALAFFGAFNGNSFPANWSDSDSDMEAKAFQAKDSLFVVDDFKPSINQAESSKLHSKAERFVRNTGNLAGRGRRNTDMTAKAAPYNRSMTIITGEELPKGQSLLGRLLVIELSRDDVHLPTLTKLQQLAREGIFSGLMAAYIQYLAGHIDSLKKTFYPLAMQYREEALQQGFASSHPRAVEIYANLVAGLEVFINFLTSVKALTLVENGALLDDLKAALKNVFSEQAMYQREQDECERFINLLRALFSSGNAHIADNLKQGPPETRPYSWGWRKTEMKINGIEASHTGEQFTPNGDCIGWYCEKEREIWLDQDSTFAKVQQMARNQGDAFLISPATLWRRMGDRGLIVKSEPRKGSSTPNWTVKRTVSGVAGKRVMVLSADEIEGVDDK